MKDTAKTCGTILLALAFVGALLAVLWVMT